MKTMCKWAFALMLAVPSVCLVSCGDDDDTPANPGTENPEQPVTPVEPSKDSAISSAEQKEKLESVALELAQLIPASDFSSIKQLGDYISDTYFDDYYDWDDVEDWADDVLDQLRTLTGSHTQTERSEDNYWNDTYIYHYIDNDYKALIAASNFTGHFTAGRRAWSKDSGNANDLQFTFTDRNNKTCVLKLETSGATKDVFVGTVEDEDWDGYWSENWTVYTSYITTDRTQLTITVPEHIVVTLTQGGNTVVKTSVDIDLQNITNNEFNFARGNFTVSCKTELNNGYTFNFSQIAYTANTKASVSVSVTKNSTSLASMSVAADVSGIPNCNLSAFAEDPEDYDFDDANGKNALVKVDVLGKVQLQGQVTDVRKFADYLDSADENDENESRFKQYVNQANGQLDVNLFYDNSAVKQATLKLEPLEEKDYYGSYWTIDPVLNFYDNTTYSIDVFFNEKDFKKVIDTYEKLGENYEDL